MARCKDLIIRFRYEAFVFHRMLGTNGLAKIDNAQSLSIGITLGEGNLRT